MGVDYAQGYYYGKPMRPEEATKILEKNTLCSQEVLGASGKLR
jgi:EAL domain-containing protein (putative c-di-GMP-specific phosphodiesterase class I)